jgi:hypothetical protein
MNLIDAERPLPPPGHDVEVIVHNSKQASEAVLHSGRHYGIPILVPDGFLGLSEYKIIHWKPDRFR